MEKSFEEILVQFYVDQYRENAKRSTGKPVKLAHYIHRLNSKAKSIKYARFSKRDNSTRQAASGNKKACIDHLLFQQ